MTEHVARRDFLRSAVGAGLAGRLAPLVRGAEKVKGPRVGVIGTGGRGTYLLQLALGLGVEIPALCDIHAGRLGQAIGLVEKARDGRRPQGYEQGPKDYQRMLKRDDLDAVIVATPMQLHAQMSIDALRAGKHVLSEVSAAMTLPECWDLVHTAEQSGKIYMLSENCCYWDHVMVIRNMVRQGLFGELTFAECGYVHDCRALAFEADGTLTWRGEMSRDCIGNLYPTHSLGPVAQWLGINRGDRLVSLVASSTRQAAMHDYLAKQFPEDHPARKMQFKVGDSTNVLIRTAKGAVIDLRYDTMSPRPHPNTCYYSLQGLKASYDSRIDGIWIEDRSKNREWEALAKYAKEFEGPLWAQNRSEAAGSGHGGADYFVVRAFFQAIAVGGPPPIDVYDAATWSSITPLSAKSLAEGGAPQEIPDFTQGKWQTRPT